jgi:hypothetical protein
MDTADRTQSEVAEAKTNRRKDKIAKLRQQMQDLKAMEQRLHQAPDGQVSLTDPDARSMATSGRGTGLVGYNVHSAVDDKHHLINLRPENVATRFVRPARSSGKCRGHVWRPCITNMWEIICSQ